MLKSRILASGILLVATLVSVFTGAWTGTSATEPVVSNPIAVAETQTAPDTTVSHPLVMMQETSEEVLCTTLDSATTFEVSELPKTEEEDDFAAHEIEELPEEAGDVADEPEYNFDNLEENAPKPAGPSEEFVFDLEKTIFPITAEEVEMLKYVIQAEAGGASLEAKRLYTLSITNRVPSRTFPNTIYEILHAKKQFSTIKNYYSKKKVPDANTIRAVEEVLMGACEDNSQNCLYFYCTAYPVADSVKAWFENDLVYLYTVGCDRFFTDPS